MLGRSFDRVQRLSITDPLTGLFNRRHFGERVAEEVRRGRRQGHATSVLCVDIDRLKAINDRFGHRAGDQAIVAVSRILSHNVRAMDVVARVGGDEFVVLLPETSAEQASALSRRILEEVARHRIGLTGSLAVSIGIAELNSSAEVDPDSNDMLAAADAALYRAKAAGGGHVAFTQLEASASRKAHAALMEGARLIGCGGGGPRG
jgi:two-component system cell cycle response regulator